MFSAKTPSKRADQLLPGSRSEAMRARKSLLFPAQSRARLDLSLDEVVLAARRVMLTQTRLRELLEANRTVADYRDLGSLLNGILNSADALVGAGSGVFEVFATREHPRRVLRCGTLTDRPPESHRRELRLRRDDETHGVLSLGRDGRFDFTTEDEQLFESFAAMASIAIANARLRENWEVFDGAGRASP